jgi:hypothetical protein
MASQAEIIQSFRDQAAWAERLGSPFMRALMRRAADEMAKDGALARTVGDWPGHAGADGLPLRFAGALHALVLSGADAGLAAAYPPHPLDIDRVWRAAEAAMAAKPAHFSTFLNLPPQTNEVRRSALLLPGFVEIARKTGLKLRLLEIGASAGLNQVWDQYKYRYRGGKGDIQWGNGTAEVEMECEWRGAPFDLGGTVRVQSRAACDRAPLDIADPAQRGRLRAYLWPDQSERLARLDGALAVALAAGVRVDRADAADWLDARLAEPAAGAVTVLYHSVVWQYLDTETRKRIRDRLDAVGQDRPLARLALEFAGEDYELRLTLWPGDGRKTRKLLARTHPHGAWLDWLGEQPQEVDR